MLLTFQIFNNIKTSAKTKLADDHNNFSGTIPKSLTRLEEKIISIIGIDCMDGDQDLGEAGFQYQKVLFFYFFLPNWIISQKK